MIPFKPFVKKIKLEPNRALPSFLSVFGLKFIMLYLIYFGLIPLSYSQEPEALTKLRDKYASAVNSSVESITSKYIQQLELLKNNCTNAEAILIDSEILEMRRIREEGVSPTTSDEVTVLGSKRDSGKDLKQLLGIWIAPSISNGYSSRNTTTTYEFKSAKQMTITKTYSSSNGVSEEMSNYIIRGTNDSIVMEQATTSGSSYRSSSEYKNYYEITMPFSYSNPEIVQISARPDGSTKSTIRLERKSQVNK